MQYNKDKIVRDLSEYLKKFPLYEENHPISIHLLKNSLYINYCQLSNSRPEKYFELEINDDSCNIISPYIEAGNGYSNTLAEIIESFCYKELNCKRFVTTPSGLAKKYGFWEKMGFRYVDSVEAEKRSSR
ncbi:MAG: hypothetical protein AABW90_00500 [Nanoarchaeota archaeon]